MVVLVVVWDVGDIRQVLGCASLVRGVLLAC